MKIQSLGMFWTAHAEINKTGSNTYNPMVLHMHDLGTLQLVCWIQVNNDQSLAREPFILNCILKSR